MENKHIPVMLESTINGLHIEKDRTYIDATLGIGGHSSEILRRGGRVLAIEMDAKMVEIAKNNLEEACPSEHNNVPGFKFKIVNDNFGNIEKIARDNTAPGSGFGPIYGVLFDLGINSLHYSDNRGFSFNQQDAELDMRLDVKRNNVTAASLLNVLRKDQLIELFGEYLGHNETIRFSEEIVSFRKNKPFEKVSDLNEVCKKAKLSGKLHPSTKVFMALRIAVNSEMENLERGLSGALKVLSNGGRIAVISFHSQEDKLVKSKFKKWEKLGKGRVITKKPIVPTKEEIETNARSRSAKMRIFKKI
jgi:16S rRNA (cytosine1402-N4)-methyltransferase